MNRRFSFLRAYGLAAALSLTAASVSGQSYTFTNIADSTGAFSSFGSPSINDAGTVAFYAELDDGGAGVFTGSGGASTPISTTSGLYYPRVSINGSGTVAFRLVLDTDSGGVFTGSGGASTTIATTGGGFSAWDLGAPSINDAGTAAFKHHLTGGGTGIVTGSGGTLTTIADTSAFSDLSSFPSINDAGTVVFTATPNSGGSGIFIGSGGATTPIVQPGGLIRNFPSIATINDAGTVAFTANSGDGAYEGVFTGSGGALTIIADRTGFSPGPDEFTGFLGVPSINDDGTVVFNGLFAGGSGLFTGDDPVADKVIQEGDTLFGSTVSQLSHGSASINNNGDIAFLYQLSNGVGGIAVARVVPEPASIVLLAGGWLIVVTTALRRL